MRLTTEVADDMDRSPLSFRAKVYLDGVEQSFVVTADTELGYVKRYKNDAAGKPIRDGDQFATEELRGKVAIIDPAYPGEPLDEWRFAPHGWRDA